MERLYTIIDTFQLHASSMLARPETYIQLAIIVGIYVFAFLLSKQIRKSAPTINVNAEDKLSPIYNFFSKLGNLVYPLLAILMLKVATELGQNALPNNFVMKVALIVAVLLLFNSVVDDFVSNSLVKRMIKWVGIPLLFLQLIGVLNGVIAVLESISITIGNIDVSVYGVFRVLIFGSLLFWLGRASNSTGQELIRRQQHLDFSTKAVVGKLLEVGILVVVFLLLLQVMGINLTALAVFGGAVGVGLGFGLQSIASNFISGLIILLDKSVSIEDYIELEDGRTGVVRELNMRSTTLETFDGKDIMVPNEKFIVESFTNWTHKNKQQRYRVDFSVAYHTDVRKLVDIIKEVVASHEQVLSGEDVPLEDRPDCEIAGFGDSGIDMFVEFWMEGIDDGKNRVGGDLMLMILEAMQEHGFEIPFPQREVRIINPS